MKIFREKDNASDKYLQIIETIDIHHIVSTYKNINSIITTGEKATTTLCNLLNIDSPNMGECIKVSLYGSTIKIFRLPSTSRAYPMRFEEKAEYYLKAFREIGYNI